MSHIDVTTQNGWALYGHPFFIDRLSALASDVEAIVESSPDGFHHHPTYKLFECVHNQIEHVVPRNPSDAMFNQGSTLGPKHRHWRRVKKGLPQRYRLFFQYRTSAPQTIIYAWLNDEGTLRKAGAKTDVYEVFRGMLRSGKMPDTYADLLAAASTTNTAAL